jgi:hypothetical protein
VFELNCVYSPLSGIVTNLSIGEQVLSVALDFGGEKNIVVNRALCRHNVFNCFNPGLSETFTAENSIIKPVSLELGWIAGIESSDILLTPDGSSHELDFILLMENQLVSVKYKDVAGVIGMNRSAPLMRDKVLQLRRASHASSALSISFFNRVPADTLAQNSIHADSLFDSKSTSWTFHASLRFGPDSSVPAIVEFDPSVTTLVLPENLQPAFRAHIDSLGHEMVLKKDSDASWTVWLSCSVDGEISHRVFVNLEIATGKSILIPNSLLRFPYDHAASMLSLEENRDDGIFICPTRISFSVESKSVIIGIQLTEAVESVVLDNINGGIIFEPHFGAPRPSFPPHRPATYLFGFPQLLIHGNFADINLPLSSTDNGLILVDRLSPTRHSHHWVFMRTRNDDAQRDIERSLGESVELFASNSDPGIDRNTGLHIPLRLTGPSERRTTIRIISSGQFETLALENLQHDEI